MKQILIISTLFTLLLVSCSKDTSVELANHPGDYTLELAFENQVNGGPVTLDNISYINAFNEDFTVTNIKYYISNIELKETATGTIIKLPNTYFLVNERNADSRTISLDVPGSQYNEVSFLIGVDSIRNVSGAQTGALDPALGMFWTWNTGYIQAKLEGTSSFSSLPGNRIEYHIGGFKPAENTVRKVTLDLTGNEVQIRKKTSSRVNIGAKIDYWFYAVHDLPIAATASCTMPGALAVQYADNYEQMFYLMNVVNN